MLLQEATFQDIADELKKRPVMNGPVIFAYPDMDDYESNGNTKAVYHAMPEELAFVIGMFLHQFHIMLTEQEGDGLEKPERY